MVQVCARYFYFKDRLMIPKLGNLKLSDFGLATLFMRNGLRRTLSTRCGTAMYMAPEVIRGVYQGDAADLWSCAVVLFVMLLGCHPWEEASECCEHYKTFCISRRHTYAPWDRLGAAVKGTSCENH